MIDFNFIVGNLYRYSKLHWNALGAFNKRIINIIMYMLKRFAFFHMQSKIHVACLFSIYYNWNVIYERHMFVIFDLLEINRIITFYLHYSHVKWRQLLLDVFFNIFFTYTPVNSNPTSTTFVFFPYFSICISKRTAPVVIVYLF